MSTDLHQYPIFLSHDHSKPIGTLTLDSLVVKHMLSLGAGAIVPAIRDGVLDSFGLVFYPDEPIKPFREPPPGVNDEG